jgi:predicted AAA+ superfamily ATPase
LITDPGLYGYLLNIAQLDSHIGFLVEEFVGTELVKLVSYQGIGDYTLLHFRTREQRAVDFAIEAADRRIVGIEVKATSSAEARDFTGLRALLEVAGDRFHRGIVLYSGTDCVPFGPKMWAVPISALWQ